MTQGASLGPKKFRPHYHSLFIHTSSMLYVLWYKPYLIPKHSRHSLPLWLSAPSDSPHGPPKAIPQRYWPQSGLVPNWRSKTHASMIEPGGKGYLKTKSAPHPTRTTVLVEIIVTGVLTQMCQGSPHPPSVEEAYSNPSPFSRKMIPICSPGCG